jgi:hypothetical protein
MLIRRFLVLTLLAAMGWCADYSVVAKSSGLVIHGDFVSEDANTVTLKVHNADVSFKKERLDLARMKELNRPQPAAGIPTGSAPRGGMAGSAPNDGKALIRGLEEQIAERKRALANYEAQPASEQRERQIHETEEEIGRMRRALVEVQLEYGDADDPELAELRNRHEEAFAEAEAAKEAYDSLPAHASQAEMDARWKRFREAEDRWHEAKDALTKALQQER